MRCIVSQASGHIWIGVAYIRVVAYIATTDIKVRVLLREVWPRRFTITNRRSDLPRRIHHQCMCVGILKHTEPNLTAVKHAKAFHMLNMCLPFVSTCKTFITNIYSLALLVVLFIRAYAIWGRARSILLLLGSASAVCFCVLLSCRYFPKSQRVVDLLRWRDIRIHTICTGCLRGKFVFIQPRCLFYTECPKAIKISVVERGCTVVFRNDEIWVALVFLIFCETRKWTRSAMHQLRYWVTFALVSLSLLLIKAFNDRECIQGSFIRA